MLVVSCLFVARNLLFAVCCSVVYCVVVSCLSFRRSVVCCMLFVVGCAMYVVCCLLFLAWLLVVCLPVAGCWLLVVGFWLLFAVSC